MREATVGFTVTRIADANRSVSFAGCRLSAGRAWDRASIELPSSATENSGFARLGGRSRCHVELEGHQFLDPGHEARAAAHPGRQLGQVGPVVPGPDDEAFHRT